MIAAPVTIIDVGHVAEHEIAEQHRPQQRGIAERRHRRDVAGAQRRDDALIADQEQHGGQRLQAKRACRWRRPAAERNDDGAAGRRHRHGGQQGDEQRRNLRGDFPGREIAQRAERDRHQREQRILAEARKPRPHDDEHADEACHDRRPAPPADRLAEYHRGAERDRQRQRLEDRRGVGERQMHERRHERDRAADFAEHPQRHRL